MADDEIARITRSPIEWLRRLTGWGGGLWRSARSEEGIDYPAVVKAIAAAPAVAVGAIILAVLIAVLFVLGLVWALISLGGNGGNGGNGG